jgi:hypothetical protein
MPCGRVWRLLVLGVVLRSPVAQGQRPLPYRWAHVTYLTLETAYIDAGTAEGLRIGSRMDVVRGDSAIAVLTINFIAMHRAACQIVTRTDSVRVGDSVRFTPVFPSPDSAGAVAAVRSAPVAESRVAQGAARGALRGQIGVDYLLVRPRDGSGAQLSQPAGTLRIVGRDLGGTGLDLTLDVRGRRSTQTRADGFGTVARLETRVYQAGVSWQLSAPAMRVTAGRQFAPGIASVGLVDGVSVQLDRRTWSGGGFAGTEPEPLHLGFSNALTTAGGYVERHSPAGALAHWSLAAGASGSYRHSGSNREFLYLRGDYRTRRLVIDLAQEVDYYRPWRRVDGEKAISPTSTFANVQFQVAPGFHLMTGIDQRRRVRLYDDVVNPATLFDDAFRRGIWAGFSARFARHFQASFDARTNHDSSSGTANTFTLAFGADRLTPLGASVRTRSTRYTTPARQGWLNSVSLGVEPFGRGSLQLTSGWRSEQGATPTSIRWLSADMDLSVLRSLFVIVSVYRERGGIESHDLLYTGASFRF